MCESLPGWVGVTLLRSSGGLVMPASREPMSPPCLIVERSGLYYRHYLHFYSIFKETVCVCEILNKKGASDALHITQDLINFQLTANYEVDLLTLQ